MSELLEKLIASTGNRALVENAVSAVRPLLDEEGVELYLGIAGMLAPFDKDYATVFLRGGASTLQSIGNAQARTRALGVLNAMGRAKWSVIKAALRVIPSLSKAAPEFVLEMLEHGNSLASIDKDVAMKYFEASPEMLDELGTEGFNHWVSLGMQVAGKSWKAAKEYFTASPEVIKKIDHGDLEQWALLGIYLVEHSPSIKASYNAQSLLAQGAGAGTGKRLDLAVQYFKSSPQILGRLSIKDLSEWVEKGLADSDKQKERGEAFFSLQTGKSRKAVEGLVRGLELRDIHVVLRNYAEALTGQRVLVRSSSLFYKNLPGLSRFYTVSDGTRIFLPSQITLFKDAELNFKTYKLSLAHELAHILFGTFELTREDVAALAEFGEPTLAFRVFEFLEDERVDYLMSVKYPGLDKDRRRIVQSYLGLVDAEGLSVFEALGFGDILPESLSPSDSPIGRALQSALWQVRDPARTPREVLDISLKLCAELQGSGHLDSSGGRVVAERVFYRGVIDYELVEESRSGMDRVLVEVLDKLAEGKRGEEGAKDVKEVEEALQRIDESEGLEAEPMGWRLDDDEKMVDLFNQVHQVLEDIEAERHIRRSVYYDEWDPKLDDYKKDWCKVREMDMPATSAVFYRQTIAENYGIVSLLRRHFGLLRPDRIKRIFREERGDDIDYDALIESVVDRHAGVTPSDRVYIRREKNLRDVSVAFLADMSYSTGDELPSGKRIIDVEREGLVLMSEALESIGDRWAVYGFSTSHRDKVDFYIVRDFDMPFSDDVKMRYENIRPLAQTRLGAVIRHATNLLSKQPSRIRLLILLSDGRPYDIDYGDADYAVEDTRRALWEGRRQGVSYFCITVDKKSRDYLPYMYGESNFTIIDNVDSLPAMMPLIYKRLTT